MTDHKFSSSIVECVSCKKNYLFSKERIKRKPVLNFFQITVACPHCGDEVHSFYTSKKIEKSSDRLKTKKQKQYDSVNAERAYIAAQSKFEKKFKLFQEEAKEKHSNI